MKYRRELQGWHSGEKTVRAALGYDKIPGLQDLFTHISPELPTQHAEFYAHNVAFLPVTSLDDRGRPWGSVLALDGSTDFIERRPSSTLHATVKSWPGNPISSHLRHLGNDATDTEILIAGLGIEFTTRRRNKFAGAVTTVEGPVNEHDQIRLEMRVNEALGNCPKYINTRDLIPVSNASAEVVHLVEDMQDGDRLPSEIVDFIHTIDTVYIGTTYVATPSEEEEYPSHLGMNARGGKPGFVRARPSDGRTLVLPDYSGNRFMTSLGNVEASHLASLTFISFDTGDILYVTGSARNVFGSEAEKIMPRASTLTLVEVSAYTFVRGGLPVRPRPGTSVGRSPYSPRIQLLTEEIPEGQSLSEAQAGEAVLVGIELHSPMVVTFTWETPCEVDIRAGQAAVMDLKPLLGSGQYQHMAAHNPRSVNDDRIRTWTVSKHSGKRFSVTLRRVPGGTVTTALFSVVNKLAQMRQELIADPRPLQLTVNLLGFTGGFVLPQNDLTNGVKLLWIAGGIGITPFLAMLRSLERGDIRLVLSARDPEVLLPVILEAYSQQVRKSLHLEIDIFSSAHPELNATEYPDGVCIHEHFNTRLSSEFFKLHSSVVKGRQIYFCGSSDLENVVMAGLADADIPAERVHKEEFSY